MRVFAGPNGSGKSTIIKSVREYMVDGHPLDFGVYINADDIAVALREDHFRFRSYSVRTTAKEFKQVVLASGLIGDRFTENQFRRSYNFSGDHIRLRRKDADEAIAQIIADFLRKKLLKKKRKFSFETVFSHPGKLEIMREARDAGYKVYLYFVSTETPEINIERIHKRVHDGGHNVPKDRIVSRYYRSLDLLYDAAQLAYQTYFFDNSGSQPISFAHFKLEQGRKNWDEMDLGVVPDWFYQYYSRKAHSTDSPDF
jgi:predicted ABC-type ATPase